MLVDCIAQESNHPEWTQVRVPTMESERYLSVPSDLVRVDWSKAYAVAAWGIEPAMLTQQAPARLEVELLVPETDTVWVSVMSADGPTKLQLPRNPVSFQAKLVRF